MILGIDISKRTFDVCLLQERGKASSRFSNDAVGFAELSDWLARRDIPRGGLHACLEATGNYGLELAEHLVAEGHRVSIVNPRQIKAFGDAELARNKTDPLDAALIARFCRAQNPPPWLPPHRNIRTLRELVRRCSALKAQRTQEINRSKAGFTSQAVRASIDRSLHFLEGEIAEVLAAIRQVIRQDDVLSRNMALLLSIPGIGDVGAAVVLAELPNIAEFEPKALAAFAGLAPTERSSGARSRTGGISRTGNALLRSTLYLCALSASRHNPKVADAVARMRQARKPAKVVLSAVARRLLVMAHAVVRTDTPFIADHKPTQPSVR
jgi:transposase